MARTLVTDGSLDSTSPADAEAPLEELAAAVGSTRPGSSDVDAVWSRFDRPSDRDRDRVRAIFERPPVERDGGTWGTRPTPGSTNGAFPRPDGRAKRGASRTVASRAKVGHGSLTGLLVAVTVLIFATTGLGIVPGHLWILGVPLLVSSLILLLPVVAWHAGIWNPSEIGFDGEW